MEKSQEMQINQEILPDQWQDAWSRKLQMECQRENALAFVRGGEELQRFYAKQRLRIDAEIGLQKAREDVKIKREQLVDTVVLQQNGGISRRQEFLLENSHCYEIGNFCLKSAPLMLRIEGSPEMILYFYVETAAGKRAELFIDTTHEGADYYRRKFRQAGLRLKGKRQEGSSIYLNVVETLAEAARDILVAPYRGFYWENEELRYASAERLTWQEVVNFAQ